jgi:hypothetical protein
MLLLAGVAPRSGTGWEVFHSPLAAAAVAPAAVAAPAAAAVAAPVAAVAPAVVVRMAEPGPQ